VRNRRNLGLLLLSPTATVLRVLMVLGGLIAAAWSPGLSVPGKEFFVFAQEAWQEAGRVSWPTRKETIQTTAIVFGSSSSWRCSCSPWIRRSRGS
jgi:preprotein translocase subunit SecE